MGRPKFFFWAVLVLALGVSGWSMARDPAPATGALEGLITDPRHQPLPGATVQVKSASRKIEKAVLSDAAGRYKIQNLPPAKDYVLSVSFAGGVYATIIQDRIVVQAARIRVESVELPNARIEEVVVSAKRSKSRIVSLEEVGTKTEFTAEFLEGLPLLGRNYQDILTLTAGVVDPDGDGNPNVLGARAENFQTLIDGVSNQDPVGGTFLANLNNDAIEEVEVITSGADASFSRASGGFANIITKSGSNDFEGTFTFAFRSSLFDGNGQTGQQLGDFSSVRPAISLSGPVIKDRLWYFFTDEEIDDDIPLNTLSGRNTLIRNNSGRRFLAKLTWQMNSANKLTAQVRSDPFTLTNLGVNSITLPEAGFTQKQGGPVYQMQLDTVFTPTILLQSLAAFTDSGISLIPTTPQDPKDSRPGLSRALVIDQDTGLRSGSFQTRFDDSRQRFTYRQDLNIFVDDFFGRHDISAGLSFIGENFDSDFFRGTVRNIRLVNTLFGADDSPLDEGGKRFRVDETLGIPLKKGGFIQRNASLDIFGFYVQDTWLPRENLSISVGLRFDREEVKADGFEPFSPQREFDNLQAFENFCNAIPQVGRAQVIKDLLASRFPDVMATFLRDGGDITDGGACFQTQGFFLTFPKESFVMDCIRPASERRCSDRLNRFGSTLGAKGSRKPEELRINNNNLAPRFSISWDPWSNGKTKFFGSWDRFFDKTNLAVASLEQGPDTRSRRFILAANAVNSKIRDSNSDPDISLVDRNLRTEFNDEWRVGFEREIAPETKIRLIYVSRHFRDQLQDVDFNHFTRDVGPEFFAPVKRVVGFRKQIVGFIPVGGPSICKFDNTLGALTPTRTTGFPNNVSKTGPLGQPDGIADDCFGRGGQGQEIADGLPDLFRRNIFFNNILFLSNLNFSDADVVTVEFIRRMKRNWQLTGSWTHSLALGAADNFLDESGNDPSLVADEFGFVGFDIRNAVTVSATTILPWGNLQMGTVMKYFSGTPFSIRELDVALDSKDQSTLRTRFPSGRRNDQRNEAFLQFDVTFEKGFLIKRYNATAQLLVNNLLAEDFLIVADVVDGQRQATRDFGRRYEARFRLNF
ncbi:MAG: carboxypeptidase regulatory-like domain-containing protein [Acidobacteriota bacterium]